MSETDRAHSRVRGPLAAYAANVTSQGGEDGIIRELVDRLGVVEGWCVDVGSWDGRHLSNTWSLWHDRGWQAILIEGDPVRYRQLHASVDRHKSVTAVEQMVEPSGPRSLPAILAAHEVSSSFEVLSIDIDGDDYRIWESLERAGYRPAIVVIEFNRTFPAHVDFVQPVGAYVGASARALYRLALDRGYDPVASTVSNLIFVRQDLSVGLGLAGTRLEDVFDERDVPFAYSDYAGRHFLWSQGPWGFTGVDARFGPRRSGFRRVIWSISCRLRGLWRLRRRGRPVANSARQEPGR